MRSRVPLFAILFAVGLFALPQFVHAGIPFFGPIIPDGTNGTIDISKCAAGWDAIMIVINNIVWFLLSMAIVFVAPLMIAYSGFLFVMSPFDPGGKSKAKSILTNTVIGIVVSLSGWVIVDAIMAILYNPSAHSGTTTLGTWSSLIRTSNVYCLPQNGVSTGGAGPGVTVVTGGGGTSGMNVSAAVSALNSRAVPMPGIGQCWQYVRTAIAAGGLSAFSSGAGTMAKNAGPLLTAAHFTSLGSTDSSPRAGDVVIIQNYSGGSIQGHAAMYNGSAWVSDFVQTDFWSGPGYRTNQPSHTFYRP